MLCLRCNSPRRDDYGFKLWLSYCFVGVNWGCTGFQGFGLRVYIRVLRLNARPNLNPERYAYAPPNLANLAGSVYNPKQSKAQHQIRV